MTTALVMAYHLNEGLVNLTLKCLKSLQGKVDEIVLLDNGSPIETDFGDLVSKTIKIDKNTGFVNGINTGIINCSGNYIVFVSNDTELLEGDLRDMNQKGLTFPEVHWSTPEESLPFPHGGFFGFPNKKFYIHDDIFVTYYSDTDLFERAKEKGIHFIPVPSVKISHLKNSTLGQTGERNQTYKDDKVKFLNKWGFCYE